MMMSMNTPIKEHPANPFEGEAPGILFGLPMPMARAMKLSGERIGEDRAQVRMGFQPDQANSRGDVHGGAIASLLDCALASAGSGDLIATAHCERRGRSISFARGEVRAEDGTLVALATGTFKLMARAAAQA
jgi:acyl-coenzyme A thioesterase PaaI-like protein